MKRMDHHIEEDAAQEASIRCLAKGHRIGGSYWQRSVWNAIRDEIRRRQRKPLPTMVRECAAPYEEPTLYEIAGSWLSMEELVSLLRSCAKQLPREKRALLEFATSGERLSVMAKLYGKGYTAMRQSMLRLRREIAEMIVRKVKAAQRARSAR